MEKEIRSITNFTVYIYVCRTYYLNIEIEIAEDRKTVQRVNFFRLIDYPPLETFHVRHALGVRSGQLRGCRAAD